MAGYYDKVSSFYFDLDPYWELTLIQKIGLGAILPSLFIGVLVSEHFVDVKNDPSLKDTQHLWFLSVSAITLPLSIPSFCLALIVAVSLTLAAPFAFLGATIADAIVDNDESNEHSYSRSPSF